MISNQIPRDVMFPGITFPKKMRKFNTFMVIISAMFTILCIYFAFTKANVNPLSISLFIFVGICSTYLYLSNLKGEN